MASETVSDNGKLHTLSEPSDWVVRWCDRIKPQGRVLDIACGTGRHALYLASLGYSVAAVDHDQALTAGLIGKSGISVSTHNLESEPWPFEAHTFDGVVVTNYLHRPLFPNLTDALRLKGVLIYETFTQGNEKFGKPSNPNFLLFAGELLQIVKDEFQIIAYEDLFLVNPKPAMVQRICALRL